MGPGRRILVVGAGPAGLTACETLRAEGFAGRIDLIGAEPRLPYARPPLSKKFLATTGGIEPLPGAERLDVRWHLGVRATGVDPVGELVLDDDRRLPFDGLIAATGSRPRSLPGPPPPAGALQLRDAADAEHLREAIGSSPGRLLIVGGGFIGCEVAATAAALGVEVTLVEIEPLPLQRLLGPIAGEAVAAAHRENGVDLRLDTTLAGLTAKRGRLTGAVLGDGSRVEAGACLLALGAEPATDWLPRHGGATTGLECGPSLLALDGSPIAAAGDLATWPHPLFDGERLRVGHWSNALDQGAHAARALLGTQGGTRPFGPVPSFSSAIHGLTLRSLGLPRLAASSRLLDGDPAARRLLVAYERRGRLVGVLGVNMGGSVNRYRDSIGKPIEQALAIAQPG